MRSEFTARVGENTATGFEILFELTNNRDDRLDYTDTWWRLWYREDAETRWTGTEVGARLLRELRLPPGETHTWRVQFEFGETAVETTDVTRNDRETVIRDVPARTGEFLFGVDLIESRPEEPALLLTRIVVDD